MSNQADGGSGILRHAWTREGVCSRCAAEYRFEAIDDECLESTSMTPTETAKAANDELAAALLNHVREAIAAFDDHYDNDTDFEDVHDAIERLRGTLRLFDKRSATAFLALHSPHEPERPENGYSPDKPQSFCFRCSRWIDDDAWNEHHLTQHPNTSASQVEWKCAASSKQPSEPERRADRYRNNQEHVPRVGDVVANPWKPLYGDTGGYEHPKTQVVFCIEVLNGKWQANLSDPPIVENWHAVSELELIRND